MEQVTQATLGDIGLKLAATVFFVLLNGFFVAAEFALVKVRPSHVDSLARLGNRAAQLLQLMLGRLDLYLSACQLGITISSLVLGWLAEPAVAALLVHLAANLGWEVAQHPWLHSVALLIALAVVTILHMVVGEQSPKIWAIQRADAAAKLTVLPLRAFTFLFRPFIWFINKLSNGLLKLFGLGAVNEHEGGYDILELRSILANAAEAGNITPRQKQFGENVLRMAELEVRHIMVPRTDVAFLSTTSGRDRNLEVIKSNGHSRFPLGAPDLDNVVGLVHTREVLRHVLDGESVNPAELARPMPTVPDTQPLSRLILDLQKSHTQCALVIDEHGTTLGMAFLEDALEEIVGPIYDEFDKQVSLIDDIEDGVVEMSGHVSLPDALAALGIDLDEEVDTIGGLIISQMRRLPREGESVEIGPYKATVLSMPNRRITRIRFERRS